MQRRTTPLMAGVMALLAFASRDAVVRPIWDRAATPNVEVVGCLYSENGFATAWTASDENDGPALVAAPSRPEPVRGSISKKSTMYDELRR